MPSLYLATERAAANLRRYVEAGGTLVVCCFSGIVDERDRVYPGPYPGALRDVLGLTVEEWLPLRAGERVTLTWAEPGIPALADAWPATAGAVAARPAATGPAGSGSTGTADVWTEAVILAGAKPVAWYADGPAAGGPAITRHDLGAGRAWYLSARADTETTAALLAAACDSAGLTPPATPAPPDEPAPLDAQAAPDARQSPATGQAVPGGWPHGLELVRRTDGQRRVVTLINHGTSAATVRLADRTVTVEAGDVQVLTG